MLQRGTRTRRQFEKGKATSKQAVLADRYTGSHIYGSDLRQLAGEVRIKRVQRKLE